MSYFYEPVNINVMQLLLIEDILRSLFFHYNKRAEIFTAFFNHSEFIIGFNFCCSQHRFTHISSSFREILGYNVNNFINNCNFSSFIHPGDVSLFKEYLETTTYYNHPSKDTFDPYIVEKIRFRAKHIRGYWKHFIILSVAYRSCESRNCESKAHDKMGLLIDEHCRHQLITLSADEANHSAGSFTYGKNHRYNNSPEEIINVSPRELEILQMLGDGMIAKEIAGKLNIGITTVITHRKNLITKFRVKNTAELIKKAGQLMLI